LQTNIFNH